MNKAYKMKGNSLLVKALWRDKKVTITLTAEQKEKARKASKKLFGKENISGYIGYLIERSKH